MALAVDVLPRIADVEPAAWNALVADESPFLEWEFLAILEEAGCVGPDTGWLPQHLVVRDGARLVGACPLYVKGHSAGEFVFDQGWATAARRIGIDYYPKLLVAVPFTPVTGARFLARAEDAATMRGALGGVLERVCADQELSSAHVNFCGEEEVAALAARGWLRRTGYQYHWRRQGCASFDDYLTSLRAKRRNQVRREQRELAEQGVVIETVTGEAIDPALAPLVYRLYRATIDGNPWGQRYLTRRFFELALERLRHRVCLVLARQAGEVIAGTFNVQKGDALYGRYWGTLRPLRHLHFNVCYYAAIAHCIDRGLDRFEPGAGGDFKHMRGFDAAPTESMHWIRNPRFRDAVAEYLAQERAAIAREIGWLNEQTAHKRESE